MPRVVSQQRGLCQRGRTLAEPVTESDLSSVQPRKEDSIWAGTSTGTLGHERAHIRRICALGRTRASANSGSCRRRSA
jgi:hypothetical protein